MKDLFGNDIPDVISRKKSDVFNDYDGFVEKFKPKKPRMIATHHLWYIMRFLDGCVRMQI